MNDPANFEFSKIDKSNFVCLKFEDSSIYYGEVALFDEQHNEVSESALKKYNDEFEKKLKEKPGQDQVKKLFKKKRHGSGVQMFTRSDGSILCKYEGQWECGFKSGEGVATYPDGSVYAGRLH
jgi:hypothetical protein